ncbi:MAG: DUF3037 domain-containing protein [Pseudomonadota bacterium]
MLHSYDYTVIRVVPRVERQEFLNVGVILFCKSVGYLDLRLDHDLLRLPSLFSEADLDMVRNQFHRIEKICAGDKDTGVFAELTQSERFNWLAAKSSSIIQASPVH